MGASTKSYGLQNPFNHPSTGGEGTGIFIGRIIKPSGVRAITLNIVETQNVLPSGLHPIRFIASCGRHEITEPMPFYLNDL